jgi:hypothetical protein
VRLQSPCGLLAPHATHHNPHPRRCLASSREQYAPHPRATDARSRGIRFPISYNGDPWSEMGYLYFVSDGKIVNSDLLRLTSEGVLESTVKKESKKPTNIPVAPSPESIDPSAKQTDYAARC